LKVTAGFQKGRIVAGKIAARWPARPGSRPAEFDRGGDVRALPAPAWRGARETRIDPHLSAPEEAPPWPRLIFAARTDHW